MRYRHKAIVISEALIAYLLVSGAVILMLYLFEGWHRQLQAARHETVRAQQHYQTRLAEWRTEEEARF